jgi:hypothetical protein
MIALVLLKNGQQAIFKLLAPTRELKCSAPKSQIPTTMNKVDLPRAS